MTIAILDDGISEEEISTEVKSYMADGRKVVEDPTPVRRNSHGTVCAKIIEKYGGKNIKLVSVRVLGAGGEGRLEDLVTALRWCRNQPIDIINLSIGVTRCTGLRALHDICFELYKKGVHILAAQHNAGLRTYPADFSFVTSVEQYRPFYRHPLMHSDIYTRGNHRIEIEGRREVTERCNSYACAFATARLAKNMRMERKPQKKIRTHTVRKRQTVRGRKKLRNTRRTPENVLRPSKNIQRKFPLWGIFAGKKVQKELSLLGVYTGKTVQKEWLRTLPDDLGNIPFVLLHLSPEEETKQQLYLLRCLEKQFLREKYMPAIVSDLPEIGQIGGFRVRQGHVGKRTADVLRYTMPDILIYAVQSGEMAGEIRTLKKPEMEAVLEPGQTAEEIYEILLKRLT